MPERGIEIGLEYLLAARGTQRKPDYGLRFSERTAKALDLLECSSGVDGHRRRRGFTGLREWSRLLGQAVTGVACGQEATDRGFLDHAS